MEDIETAILKRCHRCGKEMGSLCHFHDKALVCPDCFNREVLRLKSQLAIGWICPRCSVVHSPWKEQCGCTSSWPFNDIAFLSGDFTVSASFSSPFL